MTEKCEYDSEKPCNYPDDGSDRHGYSEVCKICALFQISDVLISIWALLDEKKGEK